MAGITVFPAWPELLMNRYRVEGGVSNKGVL